MKRVYVIIIIVVSTIVIVTGGGILKMFVIGEVKDVSSVGVSSIEVTDSQIFFNVMFSTSADVMNKYTYRIENDTMYIKIRSVLVGGLSKSSVKIDGNFSSLKRIILEDKTNQKVIWDK